MTLSGLGEEKDARRRYCFGGSRDCGGETWIGLDEAWVESCAGCCTGFGSGTWTGLLAEGGAEIFCLMSCSAACSVAMAWVICTCLRAISSCLRVS